MQDATAFRSVPEACDHLGSVQARASAQRGRSGAGGGEPWGDNTAALSILRPFQFVLAGSEVGRLIQHCRRAQPAQQCTGQFSQYL